jgi:hypothetical protein
MIATLVAGTLVAAGLVSVTFVWLAGRPDPRAQAIVQDALAATTSFHWTEDGGLQGDCFVRAAQACADDASDIAFCSRCIDPMIWAHLSQPRLVADSPSGPFGWHLVGQMPGDEGFWAVQVDVWIDNNHPLEARYGDGYLNFRYSCFNRVQTQPILRPADSQPRPMSSATVTC